MLFVLWLRLRPVRLSYLKIFNVIAVLLTWTTQKFSISGFLLVKLRFNILLLASSFNFMPLRIEINLVDVESSVVFESVKALSITVCSFVRLRN